MLLGAQGLPDQGVALIEQAIARQPHFPIAWFNRGTLLAAQGRHGDALDSVRRCLDQAPNHAGSLAVAGRSLHALGRHQEAAETLALAVAAHDGDPLLWNDHGVALTRCGRIEAAIAAFRHAVRLAPDYAQGHANLGASLLTLGALAEADAAFDTALRLDPANHQPLLYRALIAEALGQPDQALAHLRAVLSDDPVNRPARLQRIRLLGAAARRAEALADLDAMVAADPADAEVLAIRGAMHWEGLDLDAAEADLDRALALAPGLASARIDRGNVWQDRGHFAAALAEYDRALTLAPDDVTALTNCGTTLQALHRPQEALASFDRALAAGADRADVVFSRGICLLRMGRWREGWAGFEARWRPWTEALAGFTAPRWDGAADLAGKRILVAGEQGLGDMIQFARFAPRLTALGAEVIVSVEPGLRRLMGSLAGVAAIAGPHDKPAYDLFCLMMSLPALLDLDASAFGTAEPYLHAEARDIAAWRVRLSAWPGMKVGLVWAGDPRPGDRAANAMDRRRSVPLRALAALLETPGVTFVSLQKGAAAGQAAGTRVLDWSGDLHDFADTAALMTALDLVISVDTSVVHAAGALGRPVWLLNRYDGCWRWDCAAAAWYPALRMFTQPAPGAWEPVIAEAGAALSALAATS